MTKIALISGVTGQDGAYLSEFLLKKGYIVHGIKRRSSLINTNRVDHLYMDPHEGNPRFFLHYGDLTDATNLVRIIQETKPDEIYNLAAQSHVLVSFETPEYTANADALGAIRFLEALRILNLEKKVKFYQASTSELFGKVREIPQKETTPFYPRSPYAAAKLYAYWIVVNYREAYGIHASNGILFNHESPLRGETFVTRKITMAIPRIVYGLQKALYLGNIDAQRDWGFAGDYVEAMWLMLQQKIADDYVIATGEKHSVREFIEVAFLEMGVKIAWKGKGVKERGIVHSFVTDAVPEGCRLGIGETVVKIDPQYFRPTEVAILLGDASKAKEKFGWTPKVKFAELVHMMIEGDHKLAVRELLLKKNNMSDRDFSDFR